MEQQLFEWLKRASLFVILAQMTVHFSPRPVYEKYLKLLVSLMTMTVLIFPILNLVKGGISEQFQTELNQYEIQMKQLVQKTPTCDILDEERYLSTISDEIKSKLNKISNKTGYVVKTLEIQGILENNALEEKQNQKLRMVVESRDSAISTTKVDKIKCSGNPDKSTRTVEKSDEIAKLCQIYARELGMEESDLEVMIDGVEE
ncbi:MAG: stage III sporulation protein AF [Lachnospiraceae bacterium]|nr:stage III sporulation protein AF [Lachnospiraceae bacterium]